MDDAAPEFLAAARAFREALVADAEEREFARQVRNALARVYLAAALLGPPGAVAEDDDSPNRRPESAASAALQEALAARFAESNVFTDVFDPTGIDSESMKPFEHSVSWGLFEIDEDLAEAIAWLEQDAPNALWDISFGFEQHWGAHAVACLRPLHQLATHGVV